MNDLSVPLHRRALIRAGIAASAAGALPSVALAAAPDRKRQVVALLGSIATADPAPAVVIDSRRYIQHNLTVADGPTGFRAMIASLKPGAMPVDTVRVFADGDHVFAHSRYGTGPTPTIGFDVFRFAGDRIVEHWDNLQPSPAAPNPSGRTMTDGPTVAVDLDRTVANKAAARAFVEDVLVGHRFDRVSAHVDPTTYFQHNPRVGDGPAAMVAAFRRLDVAGTPHRYHRIRLLLGEGSFVLAASEGAIGDTPTAYYDLFRLADGHIAEHWDVVQTIPPRSEWKNPNGKF